MEKFIVKKVLNLKTAKGDDYKKVDLQKADGSIIEGVSAFKFKYPAQDLLIEGGEILAGVVIDGQYKNLVSATEKPHGGAGSFKQKVIEETMERKEKSISHFQDNKEWSIKLASSMTHAVNLALAELKDPTVLDTLEQSIKKWRTWILENWEVDPKDIKPF